MTNERQAEGLWLTGEYRGGVQEQDRQSDDGKRTFPGRFKASVLAGRRVLDVEYSDEAAFLAAAMADGTDVAFGSTVTLPVGVRSAKGYTFYFGRSEG
jgi:hypothetical protein